MSESVYTGHSSLVSIHSTVWCMFASFVLACPGYYVQCNIISKSNPHACNATCRHGMPYPRCCLPSGQPQQSISPDAKAELPAFLPRAEVPAAVRIQPDQKSAPIDPSPQELRRNSYPVECRARGIGWDRVGSGRVLRDLEHWGLSIEHVGSGGIWWDLWAVARTAWPMSRKLPAGSHGWIRCRWAGEGLKGLKGLHGWIRCRWAEKGLKG